MTCCQPSRRPSARAHLFLMLSACASTAYTAPGDVDAGFGLDGAALIDFGPGVALAHAVGHLPDGRIVAAGRADVAIPSDACAVTMLHPDGSLDANFGDDGRVMLNFDPSRVNVCSDLLVQPDGRIVLVGHRRVLQAIRHTDFMVIRLLPDGTLDESFSTDGHTAINFGLVYGSVDEATSVALQPDGRLVVAGRAERGPGDFDMAVVRLNADGTLDESFGDEGRATLGVDVSGPSVDRTHAVALQADGRIVLAGDSRDGDTDMLVARLTTDGQPDNSFNFVGYRLLPFTAIPLAEAHGLVIRDDGTLLLGGYISDNGTDAEFAVAAIRPNGQIETGFGNNGRVTFDFFPDMAGMSGALAMTADPSGRLLLGGAAMVASDSNIDMAVLRLLADGTPDPDFGNGGAVVIGFDLAPPPYLNDEAHAIDVLPDGDIVLAGAVVVPGESPVGADMAVVRIEGGPDADDALFASGFEPVPLH